MSKRAETFADEVEQRCREAYDNYFHKIKADIAYNQWRVAFNIGFSVGRADATADWADHITRVASATGEST